MKMNVPNEQFMKWVEQYLSDTLPPEAAEQLLHTLQNDPARLQQFCDQLQTHQLLAPEKGESMADAVLKRLANKTQAKIIRPVQWNRILLRTAAVMAVVLGISVVIKNASSPRTDELAANEAAAEISPAPEQAPKMALKKPKVTIPKGSETKLRRQIVIASSPVADAEIAMPEIVGVSGGLGSMGDAATHQQIDGALAQMDRSMTAPAISPSAQPESFGLSMPSDASIALGSAKRAPAPQKVNTEAYASVAENDWFSASDKPLSTFSIDVDTASYANVRRFLNNRGLPPKEAVRVEEMINYFEYNYAPPTDGAPFSTAMDVHTCPWNPAHQLLRVGLQGRSPDVGTDKPSNLVFLLDVSGSMNSADKLPLLKKGFTMLVNQLGENDRVAIVAYAGASGLVLDSTSADHKETIISAMDRLSAGGSTAGGAGIELAYRVAADHFIKDGINRVILATDGDFNVGLSNPSALQQLIEQKRETGVFLSVLGFGSGNLKDSTMELLANKGNGNYFYIDSEREADKVLVKQLTANMVTIAKDVKIQIEFNPAVIRSYRLIGYENRVMAAQDFADDRKDAGEIGAGHQVTALYELIPTDAPAAQEGVPLKYAQPTEKTYTADDEMLTLKLRYKAPEGSTSKLLSFPLKANAPTDTMDESFRWAAAVAAFGQYLRQSEHLTHYSLEEIQELAESAVGSDLYGYRHECIELIQQAKQLENNIDGDSPYPQWPYRN
jgi:Ca-activated chloride channel family protein